MDLLKLAALDAEDLEVFSAHLQDAVIRIGDMCYLPREQRFAMIANRFNWLAAEPDGTPRRPDGFERRRTGLHFERVVRAQASRIRQDAKDAVLDLLAIRFEPSEAPGGAVILVFAGGGAVRLDVECIEAVFKDLGPAWKTEKCPCHPLEDSEAETSLAEGRA